jgi:hypothetical protein
MRFRRTVGAWTLVGLVASLALVHPDNRAEATDINALAEVTIEYLDGRGPGSVMVSPDGTLAAFPLFGAPNALGSSSLEGVRIIDLTNPSRDQTVPVSSDSGRWMNEIPVRFSRDGRSLFVQQDDDVLVIDTESL